MKQFILSILLISGIDSARAGGGGDGSGGIVGVDKDPVRKESPSKERCSSLTGSSVDKGRLSGEELFRRARKYEKGNGVIRNEEEAVRLYRLAADQGHAHAQVNLGLMYVKGLGVAKDEREAARLFRLAADQGDAVAQAVLRLRRI